MNVTSFWFGHGPLLCGFHARLDRLAVGGIRAGHAGKEARALRSLRSSEIALIADFDVGRWAFLLRPAQRGDGETGERLPRRSFRRRRVGRLLK